MSQLLLTSVATSDDDDNDMHESSTAVDTTQSTLYEETSVSESELDVTTVEKQKAYVIFESALMLLFSTCFMCRSTYIVINKVIHFYALRKFVNAVKINMYGRVSLM